MSKVGNKPLLPENRNDIDEQIIVNLARSSIMGFEQIQEVSADNKESFGIQQNLGNHFTDSASPKRDGATAYREFRGSPRGTHYKVRY